MCNQYYYYFDLSKIRFGLAVQQKIKMTLPYELGIRVLLLVQYIISD